jgi:hypothetical protein
MGELAAPVPSAGINLLADLNPFGLNACREARQFARLCGPTGRNPMCIKVGAARLCARTAEFFELHNRDNLQDRLAFACAARHSFEDF